MSTTHLKYNLPLNRYGLVGGLLFYLKFATIAAFTSLMLAGVVFWLSSFLVFFSGWHIALGVILTIIISAIVLPFFFSFPDLIMRFLDMMISKSTDEAGQTASQKIDLKAVSQKIDLKKDNPRRDSDPFGNNSDPFGNNSDPFGNNSDPFGNNSDPFGNNSDPFDFDDH